MQLDDLPEDFSQQGLREEDIDPDPIQQFRVWLEGADSAGLREPNAMTLATCMPDGRPSARMVLLRGLDQDGFSFFTSYESRKAGELTANPHAALVFWWPALERQVRIEGTVERTTAEESDNYFRTRPRGSQMGAWASKQSEVIAGRIVLEQRMAELEQEYAVGEVPRPPFWGGFRVRPIVIEFWQGRRNRLHDRIRYSRVEGGGWRIERVSP
jgi:pyridoxamine 5'-phosphate oxidase